MTNPAPLAARLGRTAALLALLTQGLLAAGARPARAADADIDNRGFNARRDFVSQLPFEHIDPMTGNVVLTFTDLVLPGNAGFDLRVQRTYNSKIYATYGSGAGSTTLIDDSWAGLGWSLHFGRIHRLNTQTPSVEMSDGSQHQFFQHMDGDTTHFMGRDFWTLERDPTGTLAARLRVPSGVQYDLDYEPVAGEAYATEIRDLFGNKLVVKYCNQAPRNTSLCPGLSSADDAIEYVEQRLVGGRTRRVEFTTLAATQSLQKMRYTAEGVNHDWVYSQAPTPGSGYTLLTALQPPEGPNWSFTYYAGTDADTPHAVHIVTTPNGGTVTYDYDRHLFRLGSSWIYSPALTTRTTGGRAVPAGAWTYTYTQDSDWAPLKTEVSAPCASTVKYVFAPLEDGARWKLGSQVSREVWDGAVKVEEETQTWVRSDAISLDQEGSLTRTYAALPGIRTVTRRHASGSSASFTTSHTYHVQEDYNQYTARNFSDFGRPENTTETGSFPLSRQTERQFFYPNLNADPSFGTFIVDRVKKEEVRVPATSGEVFTKTYVFDIVTGFKKSETLLGITTTYQPTSGGNVYKATDANSHTTTYVYDWGVPEVIATPEWTITREINPTGTIKWETRVGGEGHRTNFTYDKLFRLKDTDPPLGSTTTREYDNTAGTYARVRRGPSLVTTHLDGYGREDWTENSLGIKTDKTYDACGRVFYESYAYDTNNIGTTYTLDALGRVTQKTNPDARFTRYEYSNGIDVKVTDENNHVTDYDFSAFGNPDDARLMSVVDAGSGASDARQTTSYEYHALGSLTKVRHPGGLERTWGYYGPNENGGTHGLLKWELHPESGTTSYTYHAAGNVWTKADARGTTTYTYDRNNRLTRADRPGSAGDTSFDYNAYDQRTLLGNPNVQSRFGYDDARRLLWRVDNVQGRAFTTNYRWDDHDNLEWLYYPSGGQVKYAYDNEGRITLVSDGAGHVYAHSFQYHPSGGVTSFTAGNWISHTTAYDSQRYWVKEVHNTGIDLIYNYDYVGNVASVTDGRPNMSQGPFTHDPVDRLKTAPGPWGSASFTYDTLGNRLTKTVAGATTNYYYDTQAGQRNLLNSASGAEGGSYAYDAVGNTLTDPAGAYTYTAADILRTATVGGVTTEYRYDGDNQRKVKLQGSDVRYYVHGPGSQILTEFQRNGNAVDVVHEYIYAGSRLLTSIRPPTLRVSPTQLTFATSLGGPTPPGQNITISEGGAWQAAEVGGDIPWLVLSAVAGNSPQTINATVNPAGLQVGSHYGEIEFTAAGAQGSPVRIPVRLVITAQPGVVVEPSGLSFVVQAGGIQPPPQYLDVLWAGPLVPLAKTTFNTNWTATTSPTWILASPPNGTTPSTITVTIDPTGLEPGRYGGAITIRPDEDSDKTIPVDLIVEAGPGEPCSTDAWFCENFDSRLEGDIGGQGAWESARQPGQVVPDPRGVGNTLLLDPSPGAQVNDMVTFPNQATRGVEVSVQVMVWDVPPDSRQIGKLEFFTTPGLAWGKDGRTFGALRFGSMLYLQYGPNINQVIMDRLEPGRWYQITVAYDSERVEAFVDGVLRFSVDNPTPPSAPFQAFGTTGWEFQGQAYLDRLQARNLPTGLVVRPQELHFTARVVAPGEASLLDGMSGGSLPAPSVGSTADLSPSNSPLPARGERDRVRDALAFSLPAPPNALASLSDSKGLAPLGDSPPPFVGSSAPFVTSTASRGPNDYRPELDGRGSMKLAGFAPVAKAASNSPLPAYGERDRVRGSAPFSPQATSATPTATNSSVTTSVAAPSVAAPSVAAPSVVAPSVVAPSVPTPSIQALASLPMAFEPNVGQTDPAVSFLARGAGYDVFLTDDGLRLSLVRPAKGDEPPASSAIGVRLVGSKRDAKATGVDPLPGVSNYFLGNDSSKWRTRVPHFRAVKLGDVYPGVDLVLYGNQGRLEYDLRVGPGADPDAIRLAFDGVDDVRLDPSGDVVLRTPFGEMRQLRPVVYQEIDGERVPRDVAYLLDDAQRVALRVANYDPQHELVIDPVLSYSTYWGDMSAGQTVSVALDGTGAIYLAGRTNSPSFPVANAFQPYLVGPWDGFLSKLTPDGTQLAYSTYLAGASIGSLAVSEDGSAYVAGAANANLPLVNPLQLAINGTGDPFVSRFSPPGDGLIYSTHLGCADTGGACYVSALAVDPSGSAYITGPYQGCQSLAGRQAWTINPDISSSRQDVFVARLTPTGSDLPMHTCLNGANDDHARGIVFAGTEVYVAGGTYSPVPSDNVRNPFPASPGTYQTTLRGTNDGFVALLSLDGRTLVSTLVGGSNGMLDRVTAIAVEPACVGECAVYAAGTTSSTDFPVTPGTVGQQFGLGGGFVAKLSSSLASLLYSTRIGASPADYVKALTVDALGRAHVTGTSSTQYVPPAACSAVSEWGSSYPGEQGPYVVRLSETASVFDYCAFLTGLGQDAGMSVAVDSLGTAILAGYTSSSNFPTTSNAIQPTLGPLTYSAFLAKIDSDTTTPTARIQFRLAGQVVQEDGTRALVIVLRSGVTDTTASVDYATQDGTAYADTDYLATSGTLTFEPNETVLAILVPLINDLDPEAAESFTLTLSNPSQGASLGGITTTAVEIQDDDDLTANLNIRDRVLPTGPNWQVLQNLPLWLTLSAYYGFGPSDVDVTVDPAGRPLGTYNAVITVTGDTGDSPKTVNVQLVIQGISDLIFKDGFQTAPQPWTRSDEPGRPYRNLRRPETTNRGDNNSPLPASGERDRVRGTSSSSSVGSSIPTAVGRPSVGITNRGPSNSPAGLAISTVGTANRGDSDYRPESDGRGSMKLAGFAPVAKTASNSPLPVYGERGRVRGTSLSALSALSAASTSPASVGTTFLGAAPADSFHTASSVTTLAPRAAAVEHYYHLDALGSVRVVTDAARTIVERHDYLPFGEECTTGPCAGNPAGIQPRKFTGKERDAETGLDYFGARYYGSKTARFTTIDPVYTWKENLADPQRWNRYAYGRNNPFRYVDPDGKNPVVVVIVGVAAAWAFFSAPDVANAPGPKDPTYVSDRTGEMMGQAAAAVATAMGVKHVGTALDLMRRSDPVSQEGLGRIDQHLRRLGASDDPPNAAMLQRLREGKRGREDLSFYRHELHEASLMEKGADSRSAHLRTLEWQGIPYKPGYEKELYSREVIERFADRFNPAARQ